MEDTEFTGLHRFDRRSIGEVNWEVRVEESQLVWKNTESIWRIVMVTSDIGKVTWMDMGTSNYLLTFFTKEGKNQYGFGGFTDEGRKWMINYLRNHGIDTEDVEFSISGRVDRSLDISGDKLCFFEDSMHRSFELSLKDLTEISVVDKNEAILKLHVDNTIGCKEVDSLDELHIHVREESRFGNNQNLTPAEALKEYLMENDYVRTESNDRIVSFKNAIMLSPMGVHDIGFQPQFFRLVQNYKTESKMVVKARTVTILYRSIVSIFSLPKSEKHTFVVISLDTPLVYGSDTFEHVVIQFKSDEVVSTTLSMSEELFESRFTNKLKKTYEAPAHEVMLEVLQGLSDFKPIKPDVGDFKNSKLGYALHTSLIADGKRGSYIFPLDTLFFVLPKPTTHMHDEIQEVDLVINDTVDSFNFVITLKSGGSYTYYSSDLDDYNKLKSYLKSKYIAFNRVQTEELRGFNFFVSSRVQDLKKENPTLSEKAIGNLIMKLWQELPDEEQQLIVWEAEEEEQREKAIARDTVRKAT